MGSNVTKNKTSNSKKTDLFDYLFFHKPKEKSKTAILETNSWTPEMRR